MLLPQWSQETEPMIKWTVKTAYDPDRRAWYVRRSNIPGLRIEAATLPIFKAEVDRLCRECAAGGDFQHTVEVLPYWTLSSRFMRRVIVNGRLVSAEQAKDIQAQYASAV